MASELTQQRLKELLHYDAETGRFTWLKSRQCVKAGAPAGSVHKDKGYVNIRVDLRLYRAHRLAWLYAFGSWPTAELDHINGIKTDNRLSNLRDVTHLVNQQNLPRALGATNRGKAWEAAIKRNGRSFYLGRYAEFVDAVKAYKTAKLADPLQPTGA